MFVAAGLTTLDPPHKKFFVRDVVTFQVIDSFDGTSARGHLTKRFGGIVRPLLEWNTNFLAAEQTPALELSP